MKRLLPSLLLTHSSTENSTTDFKALFKTIAKYVILMYLVVLLLFGLTKCVRTSFLSFAYSGFCVKDTELLFNLHDFDTLKNVAYRHYLSARKTDKEVERVAFDPMSTVNNISIIKHDDTLLTRYNDTSRNLTVTDEYDYDQARNIQKVLCSAQNSGGEISYLVTAYENTVVFWAAGQYYYRLIYTANGLYPDGNTFKSLFHCSNNVEFVRISGHWFHCFIKSNNFWGQ